MENTTQVCNICHTKKSINLFSKRPQQKGGHFIFCKECGVAKSKAYQKTKDGLIAILYNAQKSRIKRVHNTPTDYDKTWFKEWVLSQDLFHKLYLNWVESDYLKDLKPSVDRIDDMGTYSKDNIQLMTWKQNTEKASIDTINGKNTKRIKAVIQLDLNGNFIARFHSIAEATRITGCNHISCVCSGNRNKSGGFIWKYE